MNNSIQVMIVEDESIIAEELKRLIMRLGYVVTGVAHRYLEAVQLLQQHTPDIVLLDIRLEYSTNDGIDLADYINTVYKIPFIYITANADTNTVNRAKQTSPAAYITKPFNAELVYSNIEIALHKKTVVDRARQIQVKNGSRKIVLDIQSILFLKADNLYTEIYTADGRKFVVREYLKQYLTSLSAHFIVQVHRSYAVNIHHISYYNNEHVCISGHKIPVSDSHRRNLSDVSSDS